MRSCNEASLRAYLNGSLSESEMAAFEAHAIGCSACSSALESHLGFAMKRVAQAVQLADVPPSVVQRVEALGVGWRRGRFGHWPLVAGAASLTLATGLLLGAFGGIALLVPQVQAKPVDDFLDVGFLNEAFVHGGSFFDGFENGLGEWEPRIGYPNYGVLDDKEAHSGQFCLRLLHRPWGGEFTKRLTAPIPKGSLIRVAFWVLSPRGGTADNKWLNAGLSLNPGQSVGLDILSVDSRWQPATFQVKTALASEGLQVQFTTGGGHGRYDGWDWASWIDDVRVYLHSPPRTTQWRVKGDTIHVSITLPKPYEPSDVRQSEVYLRTVFGDIPKVRRSKVWIEDEVLKVEFRSAAFSKYLRTRKNDLGDLRSLDVIFTAQRGDIPCIFSAGIVGVEGERSVDN